MRCYRCKKFKGKHYVTLIYKGCEYKVLICDKCMAKVDRAKYGVLTDKKPMKVIK